MGQHLLLCSFNSFFPTCHYIVYLGFLGGFHCLCYIFHAIVCMPCISMTKSNQYHTAITQTCSLCQCQICLSECLLNAACSIPWSIPTSLSESDCNPTFQTNAVWFDGGNKFANRRKDNAEERGDTSSPTLLFFIPVNKNVIFTIQQETTCLSPLTFVFSMCTHYISTIVREIIQTLQILSDYVHMERAEMITLSSSKTFLL